jgi:hypothetical protein
LTGFDVFLRAHFLAGRFDAAGMDGLADLMRRAASVFGGAR